METVCKERLVQYKVLQQKNIISAHDKEQCVRKHRTAVFYSVGTKIDPEERFRRKRR